MHKIIMPRHRTLIRNAAANRIEQYHSTSFNQIKAKLEQRTHLFIVVLGMLIGSSIALGIGYHLSSNLLNYTSVHDKFHRTLVLSGFFFLKIASTFLNSSFFPKPIKRRIAI